MKRRHRVLFVPDLHTPYDFEFAPDFLADQVRIWKPTKIVFAGDENDQHRLSVHAQHPDMPGPKDEYEQMIRRMRIYYKLFPKAQICISNHGARPFRVAFNSGLPSLYLKEYKDFMQAPRGWSWHNRVLVDNVVYEHGEGVSGRNAAWQAMTQNKKSTCIGHIHGYGGVTYSSDPFNQTFAMNAGCLIDVDSLAFAYGEKYRNKATLGCGAVIEGVEAHFIRVPV
jgi:hypothetical protein